MNLTRHFFRVSALVFFLVVGQTGRFADPAAGAAPPLHEPLVIVANRANTLDDLSIDELRRIFLGQRGHWPNGRRIIVVMRPAGSVERETMLRQLLQMTDTDYDRHVLRATFTGEVQSPPKELTPGSRVLKYVYNVPGAVGYVRASEVDDTVKVLRLEGRGPEVPEYPLQLASQ